MSVATLLSAPPASAETPSVILVGHAVFQIPEPLEQVWRANPLAAGLPPDRAGGCRIFTLGLHRGYSSRDEIELAAAGPQ